ncbi:MAG: EAL domain-containing protein [Deltaproteobacteria bacterium]|nr:EAL domain-containing protein [Deltaproteobacteria bacterium]
MSDSVFTGSDHLYWLWALASIVPAVGAIRALRRSGAEWSRPVVVLQIAMSISIASLALPLLLTDGMVVWADLLWAFGSTVASASILLLAMNASSRRGRLKPAVVLPGCAVPAVALLALAMSPWGASQSTALAHQWGGENAGLGVLLGWALKLPLTLGLPCLLASLVFFFDEYLRPPKSNLRHASFAGGACAVPSLAIIVCAIAGKRYGLEPASLAYLVPSVVFGWILYPGRIAHLTARMAAIDALGEAVVIIDSTNKIVDANGLALDLLKPATGDLRGRSADEALSPIPELVGMLADPSKICVEFFTGKTAGTRRCHEARLHSLENSESEGSRVVAIRDITSNRVAEDKLFYQAHFDSLTGLPNRRLFLDKISSMINEAKQEGHQVALMYLDFDRFKEINDSLGHSAGDELLRIMAHRLRQHLRSSDTLSRTAAQSPPEVSRLGGDEFAILMSRFESIADVEEVATRILGLVSDPVTIGGQCVWNACSIGIAIYPDDGDEISTLVKNADAALYYAKNESRGQYEFYRSELRSKVVRKASLEKQLRGAIEADELSLHYQPKIDLKKEEVGGAEAILRWDNSELGSIPPKEFIPVAEDCGLIASIGAFVIERACAQMKEWRDAGLEQIPISVNVSCFQFTRMDLRAVVVNALNKFDIDPGLLELELTESALLDDNDETASCLREFRAMGVKISLDDFGTGYSALSYLSRVPLDVLKMDRAFIRDVHSDPSALGVASAVVAMAHSLNLRVVAEGVDCAEQIEPLRRMGCDLIQGFIFSAAVDAEEFSNYLTPEGRRVPLESVEPQGHPTADSAEVEVQIASEVAPLDATETHEVATDRHALIIDDDRMQIGRTAMRMNQMGIPSYYARDFDEGVLFTLQEPGRIRALFVSTEARSGDIERVAQQVADQLQGDRPSIVIVGEKFDSDVVAELREKSPVWSLRMPFDDAELAFVAEAALSNSSGAGFLDRHRVPMHLMAWTRVGDVTGHGVISSLSPRGAFIEMDEPLPVGTAFQLEFSLSEWPVSLRARVVYLKGGEDNGSAQPTGVGVVFLDCDREVGDRIVEAVEKRSARYIP